MFLKEVNSFLLQLKVKELKSRCKFLGLKGYTKLKKNDLIDNIKFNIAASVIQRWYRKKFSYNDLCLISLEKIRYPCWPLRVSNGWMHYNLPDLVDFFLSSGDFREPQSKRSLTAKELKSLDDYVKKIGLKKKSLLAAKKNTEYYRKQKIKEEHRDTIVEQIRDVVCIIRDRLSDFEENDSAMDIALNLEVIYFPTLNGYMRTLARCSKRYLKISIENCSKLIKETNII